MIRLLLTSEETHVDENVFFPLWNVLCSTESEFTDIDFLRVTCSTRCTSCKVLKQSYHFLNTTGSEYVPRCFGYRKQPPCLKQQIIHCRIVADNYEMLLRCLPIWLRTAHDAAVQLTYMSIGYKCKYSCQLTSDEMANITYVHATIRQRIEQVEQYIYHKNGGPEGTVKYSCEQNKKSSHHRRSDEGPPCKRHRSSKQAEECNGSINISVNLKTSTLNESTQHKKAHEASVQRH